MNEYLKNTKTCRRCGINKNVSEFKYNKSLKDNLHSYCRECTRKINRAYYSKNKIKENTRTAAYKKLNKGVVNNYVNKRRNLCKNIILTPFEKKELLNVYKLCAFLNRNGIIYHVDHIIPISKGGWHHPNNLQILFAKDNLKKSNKIL